MIVNRELHSRKGDTHFCIPWRRVLLEKLTGFQLVKKFPASASCPYHEPARSSPHPTSQFLKIHLNITFPPTPGSPKWSLSPRFSYQNPLYASPLPIRATCPAHLILSSFITRTILGEEYRSLSSSLCSFLNYPVTSSLLGPNIVFSTHSLRSSLNVSLQVSHPYQTKRDTSYLKHSGSNMKHHI